MRRPIDEDSKARGLDSGGEAGGAGGGGGGGGGGGKGGRRRKNSLMQVKCSDVFFRLDLTRVLNISCVFY